MSARGRMAMQAGTLTPSGSNTTTTYQTPQVIELGDVVTLTNGTSQDDTADMGSYYY
ncbi:lasso RiPP family leader peptide-containing protein [Actinosynnema sp. CS-041913]|uniref:lasso RiPP family leader peptide-containing protein n=1 Tax=Actinosynnema sp. CS-041913 TaxID=3239917 RepID=UPI003D8C44A2